MQQLTIERALHGPRRSFPRIFLLVAVIGLEICASAATTPYGMQARPGIGPFLNRTLPSNAPAISGNWSAVVAFPKLLFTNAVGLAPVPGSTRLCVWEREGYAWIFENDSATATKILALDISNQCQGWDDSGLLGLAFHPGFATNHYVYVYYTWVKPGTVVGSPTTRPEPVKTGAYHDRLSRFTLDSRGIAIPGSELVLVDQAGNSVWHNGGGLFVHPRNGFLYWTDGDDADSSNTQILNRNLFSGVFRIDVDQRGGSVSHPIRRQPANGVTANYFIPNDNPFVGQGDALEEYFCLGLRNPHRMTCDPVTGRIFIGDVGESMREEVDVIEPGESGLNFQWSVIEGAQGDLTPPYPGINRRPKLDYSHSDGRAVIGGYVYRGKKYSADLGGRYIFGDNVLRIIWAMDETTTPASKAALCILPKGSGPNSGTDYTGLSSFGTDAEGEIYMCQMSSVGGRIYTLARAGKPPPLKQVPRFLSQTGVFSDLKSARPAPGLIPYTVNTPLWSDGAVKSRWVAVPANRKIRFAAAGEWAFPEGTVFVKNFSLPVDDADSNVIRRLETRLIVRDSDGFVYGASYKWMKDLSDAELVTSGTTEDIPIKTANGTRTQQWFYPGRQDCLRCHTPESGGVLGVNVRQLNCDLSYPGSGVTDNQIRAWNHIGLFSPSVDERNIAKMTRLVAVSDTRAPVEQRARSYLDANCAICHRPGGAHAFFDARFDTPLEKAGLVNGPAQNALGVSGAKIIVPGNPDSSLLLRRVLANSTAKMPPLARNVVDESAAAVFADWIRSLPPVSNGLPAPWSFKDIGDVGLAGEASADNGRFNLVAAGGDIWGDADAFEFAYTRLSGDGEIVARLVSMQPTDPWAKAGVMLRESLAADSAYALIAATPANGTLLQRRNATGGKSYNVDGPPLTVPCWLRLKRSGHTFSAFVSIDGREWKQVTSVSIPMQHEIYAGLSVVSHNRSRLNSTLFDNVTLANPPSAK